MQNLNEPDIHHQISHNAAVSMAANIFYLVTRVFIPPIILHHISLGEYGLWSYCFILIGYISMGTFGISNVYVRYIAVYDANRETDHINRLVSTGIVAVSSICLLFVPFLWFGLPWILNLFHVTPELYHTAFYLIFGTTLIFLADLNLNVFSAILQSLQKFTLERLIWAFSFTVETILIVLFLVGGLGVYGLMWAYLGRVLVAGACYLWGCYWSLPGLSLRPSFFDPKLLKLFYHFGGIVQLTGVISTINRSIEKVLAGLFWGPTVTALFDIGKKLPLTATYLPSSINAVFLPATAHLHAQAMHAKILEVYVYGSRWVNMITGLMMGFMAPFSFALITCWLGPNPKYDIAAWILLCFTLACQADTMTGPASAIYRSINRPSRELVYPLMQLAFVLLGALVGFSLFGYSILVITVVVVLMTVASVAVYVFLNNRFLGVSQWDYCKKVIVPGLLPYLFGSLIYLFMRSNLQLASDSRWVTLGLIVEALTLYLALVIPFVYFFLCDERERANIHSHIRHSLSHWTIKK